MKEQKSIAAVMEAKKASAIEEVSNLLWQDKPAEKIAAIAIAGGLSAAEVEKVEAFISNAKSELAKLDAFDVARLKADAITAKAAYDKAEAKLEQAQAQRDEVAYSHRMAAAQLYDAQQAYVDVANQVECGELPADRAPGTVKQILSRRTSGEEIHAMEQRLKDLIRLKHDNQNIVDQYQKRVDQAGSHRGNVTVTPGGLVSEADMLKQKLVKHTVDQAAVVKAIARLETEIIAAVADYKKMPSPFALEIEATEVSNG